MRDRDSIPSISDLSSHLFWDMDRNRLDVRSSKRIIVQRVLEFGMLKDWKALVRMYGMEGIEKVAVELRSLDDVTLSFLCTIFDRKKEDFRCYRLRQSNPHFWSY